MFDKIVCPTPYKRMFPNAMTAYMFIDACHKPEDNMEAYICRCTGIHIRHSRGLIEKKGHFPHLKRPAALDKPTEAVVELQDSGTEEQPSPCQPA